jgi:hypothetical protein
VEAVVVGAQFGYAGFTIGGAYGYDNNGLGANYFTGVDNDTQCRSPGYGSSGQYR